MEPVVTLGKQDAGRTINLTPGQRMVLSLDDISTTGYRWDISALDPSVLALEDSRLAPHPGIGAGGARTFTFRANQPGQCELIARLKRPWESEPIEELHATIIVAA